MLIGEATNTNFIIFGLTQTGLEPTIYRTRNEHTNHYATDAIHTIKMLQDQMYEKYLLFIFDFSKEFDLVLKCLEKAEVTY